MRSVAVYCGSASGANPAFGRAATALGHQLAEAGCTLVYGGSNAGLMGMVADAALAAGGRVIGVIPDGLFEREVAHLGLTELHVVRSMHERKALMNELAEGFVALPGGIGTLDELVEMYTWNQLGIHRKPCALLNIDGYYDSLLAFLRHAADQGLLQRRQLERLLVAGQVEGLLPLLEAAARAAQPVPADAPRP
ncbi:MAG TPA: TIGR00730 family Rossman fold protein [Nevskia sp.]|nr:TIGR00730 family Rossman fold protein [Nevskia sp.]